MPEIKWNTDLYDEKHSFVPQYGKDLVSWLEPRKGERILDLGCGTGELTNSIAEHGAKVIGIDNSAEMIEKAKESYPGLEFKVMDATNFYFARHFDAIFSNAVLHWINNQESVIKCMYKNLRTGGRIALEFGGKGNVQTISNAIKDAMIELGFEDRIADDFWFFPSADKYTEMLENIGFNVQSSLLFDRETELVGEDGMKDWIEMFGAFFFKHINSDEASVVISKTVELLRPTNYRKGNWYADYKRLRIKAFRN